MAEEEAAEVPPEPVPSLTEEDIQTRLGIFEEIFKGYDALEVKQKSMAERREKEAPPPADGEETEQAPVEITPNIALAYSELNFQVVANLVDLVKQKCGPMYPGQGVFLDFGSGCGKLVLAAALLHPFQKVIGIEALQSLNEIEAAVQAKYAEVEVPEGVVKPEVSFVKGDFVSEFDAVLEPIAPEATFAIAVATTFGDPEMQAVSKLAQKMPQGASLFLVTQKLEESLVVDVNRNPRQRRSVATKKALAQRGVEPTGIEIELEPAENDPNGWRLKDTVPLELEWGTTNCYLYKKYSYPYCDVNDICMATPLPEAEDQTVVPAFYMSPTTVVYMDDLAEIEKEVSKTAPFCEESRKKAVTIYEKKLAAAKQKATEMLSEAVAEALACVRKESEAYAQDGNVHYKLEEASDTAKLLEALISGEGLPSSPKVTEFMGTQWLAACGELDPEATGVVPEAQLPALWGKVKAGFAEHIERALKQLKDFGVEVPESEHRPQESVP
ncbi:unnamed protein product [Durusdinium trenchii]